MFTMAFAEPYPSAVGARSEVTDIRVRSEGSGISLMGAMSKLQKHDTILTLMKRSLEEMEEHPGNYLVKRQTQITPTDPKTGDTGKKDFDFKAWDDEVIDACDDFMILLSGLVSKVTDPAGVAVCYNIPYYNSTTGAFASDIRLWKISNGTADWESAKKSLAVQYSGAKMKLVDSGTGNGTTVSGGASTETPTTGTGSGDGAIKGSAPDGKVTVNDAAKAVSSSAAPPSNTAAPASKSAPPAPGQTPPTAGNKNAKRMDMAEMMAQPEGDDATEFNIELLRTMRFVGQVNPDIMSNETLRKNPALMKLVLTPALMVIGDGPNGLKLNASVAAAQVQFVAGAFSNITVPVPPAAPFQLPGTFISIFPLGLYLFSVYFVIFVAVVGFGTVQRYLFRMSFRKRSAMMNGQDGFGKI